MSLTKGEAPCAPTDPQRPGGAPSLPLTRRAVLTSAVAAPIASHALAAEPRPGASPTLTPNLLNLDLARDGKTLTITEIGTDVSCFARWCISAILFGPHAYFAFPRLQPLPTQRAVLVRNASCGLQTGLELTFTLTWSTDTLPSWLITVSASMWGSSPPKADRPITFRAFANGTPTAWLHAPASLVGRFVTTAFGGLLETASVPADTFDVSLDRAGTWCLQTKDGRASMLWAFDHTVKVTGFEFGWKLDLMPGSNRPSARFSARALHGTVEIAQPLQLGPTTLHHLILTSTPGHAIALEVQIGPAALEPRALQVAIGLHVDTAELTIYPGDRTLAGPVSLNGLTLTATTLPDGTLRSVVWADVMQSPAPAAPGPVPVIQRDIDSPIGRLRVGPPDLDARATPPQQSSAAPAPSPGTACGCVLPPAAESPYASIALFLRTASGDRAGAPAAALFAVHDAGIGLRRVTVELSLFAASVAPPDTSYSRLDFDRADLRLHFEDGRPLTPGQLEYPLQRASSWIWAGPHDGGSSLARASLDLSRATLTCMRDYDLAKLRLRFNDLILAFAPGPTIRPARDECRVLVREGEVQDSRPVIVAQFDPQHVMEQALFRPNPRPLPDIELATPSRQAIVETLSATPDATVRATYRLSIQQQKIAQEQQNFQKAHQDTTPPPPPDAADTAFADFAGKSWNDPRIAALATGDRADQAIYIGPFALDPDVMGMGRVIQQEKGDAAIDAEQTKLLDEIEKLADPTKPHWPPKTTSPPATMDEASRRETVLEQLEPVYGLYREVWRDVVTRAVAGSLTGLEKTGVDLALIPMEFVTPTNRPTGYLRLTAEQMALVKLVIDRAFTQFAAGKDAVTDSMPARLSGATRLAFRINCTPLAGLDATEAGLPGSSGDGPSRPGSGSTAYAPLAFSFAALTDWSRHEPSVTRRARKLFEPLATGILPPLGNRGAQAGDTDMLRYQGISKGSVTVDQRLAEVRGSLVPPTPLETAIELPARLTLSTAQDAIWLTNRQLPLAGPVRDRLESGQSLAPGQATPVMPPHRLWTARLAIADAPPALRAVWSPDLRPMAVGSWPSAIRTGLPGHAAPPRGPWAPWFIGPEQSEGGTIAPPADCTVPNRFPLLAWLCKRQAAVKQIPSQDYRLFRTTLDAWDRHQIVLQSSAYGLPVTGARKQGSTDVEDTSGPLVAQSGQFEPTDDYKLLDADAGQAVYRPMPLDVRELSLTALGGSFLHDTRFIPAAGVALLDGNTSFDGFSIQRWQHDVVLGRDMRAEVVYKGYLMPFGHRASLVKLTERIFLRTPTQGIKAILRQRLFLRMVRGVTFPQVGQPHFGRLWCSTAVTLKVDRTPDLIDPMLPLGGTDNGLDLSGRVPGIAPGLAFWPRTDVTPNGLLQFDCDLGGPVTRLPMLFLDKIAATNPESLRKAAEHYNQDALVKWRTLALGGQKLRYANEDSPGDTSFVTDWLKLRVHGRNKNELKGTNSWTGDLDQYGNTSVLEGADQPSFYPALDEARIRFDQVERLTGSPARACVQYDGHYIRYGMPKDALTAGDPPPYPNPSAVFLDLRDSIRLDMGNNGDRSGGIGRPNTSVVAISRSHGPLGAGDLVAWRDALGTTLTTKTPGTGPIVLLEKRRFTMSQGLASLASQFDADAHAAATSVKPKAAAGPQPTKKG